MKESTLDWKRINSLNESELIEESKNWDDDQIEEYLSGGEGTMTIEEMYNYTLESAYKMYEKKYGSDIKQ